MEASALTTASHRGLLARRSPLLRLQSDDRLVALIRNGHDRAFEVLFDRYQARLLAFCRHLLSSAEDAEDVLQDVFVAAHAAMLADDRPIKARPWLYRIARNRCLNFLRRPVAEGQDSMDVHAHGNGTTTLEQVQRREELRAIVADMHELPETQRTALVLREIDDLSYEEIAQAMGATLPAVKSLLVRARMSLAESSEARILTCDEVRLELAEAAEGLRKASGPVRRHVRGCDSCRRYRGQLRTSTKAVAALAPLGLVSLFHKLIGLKLGGGSALGGSAGSAGGAGGAAGVGGAAGGAGAAAGSAGGVGAAAGSAGSAVAAAGGSGATLGGATLAAGGAAGGTLGAKAAVGMATAALFTAGAVGVNGIQEKGAHHRAHSQAPPSAAEAQAATHVFYKADRQAPQHNAQPKPVASAQSPAPAAEPTGGTKPTKPAPTTAADAPKTTPQGSMPPDPAPPNPSSGDPYAPPNGGWNGTGGGGGGSPTSGSSDGGKPGSDPTPPPPDPTPPPPDPTPPPPDPTPPPPDPNPPPPDPGPPPPQPPPPPPGS
jgi:RNA polymerase sigma factor (sigma-70 family)